MITNEEKEAIQELSLQIHGSREFYHELFSSSDLKTITNTILTHCQKERQKGAMGKEVYQGYKNTIRDLLKNEEIRKKREEFLKEPSNWLEEKLKEKIGIKNAKVSTSKLLIIFDDDEELEVDFDRDYGLLSTLGGNAYTDPEGI